jgi:hypothetical protein
MTTTLDVVSPKKHQNDDRSAEAAATAELVRLANEQGLALTGPHGLLKLFTKNVLETALNEELTEHLGHEKNRAGPDREGANVRNGTRAKTVLTEATWQVAIKVPRGRDGTFEPQVVRKRQRRLNGGRGDRAVAVCERGDHGRDQRALRADLRCLGQQGDDLADRGQGHRGDERMGCPAAG